MVDQPWNWILFKRIAISGPPYPVIIRPRINCLFWKCRTYYKWASIVLKICISLKGNISLNHWGRRFIFLSSFRIRRNRLMNYFLDLVFKSSLGYRCILRTLLWSRFFGGRKRSNKSGRLMHRRLRNLAFISFPFSNSSNKKIRIRWRSYITWRRGFHLFACLKSILGRILFLPLTISCMRDTNRGRVGVINNKLFIIWDRDTIRKCFEYTRTKSFWRN